MLKPKQLAAFCIAVAVMAAGLLYLYNKSDAVEQKSVLKGVVCEEGLVRTGKKVQLGDVLVKVRSVAGGSIAAARASGDGMVQEVLVRPGDTVMPEQTVVILEI